MGKEKMEIKRTLLSGSLSTGGLSCGLLCSGHCVWVGQYDMRRDGWSSSMMMMQVDGVWEGGGYDETY